MTPPPAPVQSRHGLETGFQNATRCRGPGCGAVGKAMLEGYCDKCYVKEQSARLNQVAHRTPHSPPLVMVSVSDTFSLLYFTIVMCFIIHLCFFILCFAALLPQFPIDISPLCLYSLPFSLRT